MGRNVEIKARVKNAGQLRRRVAEIADAPPEIIEQEDTFFRAAKGRLKLRVFEGGNGELIYYRRPDAAGPKTSEYEIAPVADPAALKSILERVLGVSGVVRKRRELHMVGRTRIHLDDVAGLGDFIELEVVLRETENIETAQREAEKLLETLGIDRASLVAGAYVDLLG